MPVGARRPSLVSIIFSLTSFVAAQFIYRRARAVFRIVLSRVAGDALRLREFAVDSMLIDAVEVTMAANARFIQI